MKGATANQDEIDAALDQAAERDDDPERRRRGAGPRPSPAFPTVASIAADASFPHKLTITVTERLPVAVLEVERRGDRGRGRRLRAAGLDVEGEGLPRIESDERHRAARLDAEGAAQAAILGGAPDELRERIEAVELGLDEGRGRGRARGGARAPLRRRRDAPMRSGRRWPRCSPSPEPARRPTSTSAFPNAPSAAAEAASPAAPATRSCTRGRPSGGRCSGAWQLAPPRDRKSLVCRQFS